jgi:hypothetical protein
MTSKAPTQSTTSGKVVLKTEKGMVNKEEVKKLTSENIPHDAPLVRTITTN